MKDTHIIGVGAIPETRTKTKIFFMCNDVYAGGTPDTTNELYYGGDIPWIASGKCQDCDILDETKFITKEGLNNSSTKIIPANTTLLAMTGATCGKTGFLRINGCANQSVTAFVEDKNKSNGRYLYYGLQAVNPQILLNKTGGAQGGINVEDCKNIKLPFPPLSEQEKIADYLDNKCKKIDDIIADNEKEIELLNEFKVNIYDVATLRGIKKHELKPVNHYSINAIPDGWKFGNVLFFLSMPITDGPHETPKLIDNGIPFISAEAIKNGKIDFDKKRGYISEEDYNTFCKKYTPQIEDIYMIKSGATTGKVAMVETDDIFNIWSPLGVFRCDKSKILPMFLYYQLQSNFFQKQVQLNWTYGTQQNIGMRTLEGLKVVVPPIEEQKEIVDYINKQCSKIDETINLRQQIIDKLQEYKKSLIYECVTGKKEIK